MFVRVFDAFTDLETDRPHEPRERGYELHPLHGDRYRLLLFGAFRRTWADSLCQGLRKARVDIVRGHARRERSGAWRACFELQRTGAGTDPILLDLLALCDAKPGSSCRTPLAIEHFELERDPGSGGLALWIEAPDRLGFLAGLLERFSFLSLVAEDMSIETAGPGVRDRFLLLGSDGKAPSRASERALAGALRGKLCRTAA